MILRHNSEWPEWSQLFGWGEAGLFGGGEASTPQTLDRILYYKDYETREASHLYLKIWAGCSDVIFLQSKTTPLTRSSHSLPIWHSLNIDIMRWKNPSNWKKNKIIVSHTTSPRAFQRSQDNVNCKNVKRRGFGFNIEPLMESSLNASMLQKSWKGHVHSSCTLTLFFRGFFRRQNQSWGRSH